MLEKTKYAITLWQASRVLIPLWIDHTAQRLPERNSKPIYIATRVGPPMCTQHRAQTLLTNANPLNQIKRHDPAQLAAVTKLGCAFAVSPGFTPEPTS